MYHVNSGCVRRLLWCVSVWAGVTAGAQAGEQVTELAALHREGQTFLLFREVGKGLDSATPTVEAVVEARRALLAKDAVRYRVYRSREPITKLEGLSPLAEVPPLTCWNVDYYGDDHAQRPAMRYVIEEGKTPVAAGSGLFVHNPDDAGRAYYAVTAVVGGKENMALGAGNALRTPLEETLGRGVPVLQRVERPAEWQYVKNPVLHYYVRWEGPPECSVEGKPFDYVVGVPPERTRPAGAGIHLHCWGGSLDGGYGWWYQAEQGHLLIASNQVPYDWWTGYHERYWKNAWERAPREESLWRGVVVHPYSQTRLLSFLAWAARTWDIDLARTHVAGSSMGGSGAPMFAIRHPEKIAWATAWVGVHIPRRSPQFAGSYAQVYGEPEWKTAFEDGTNVWDYFDDAAYLRAHPARDIGLICFSNGKNDGAIGWPQAVEFFRALQETRQPHIFVWGQSGHGQRAVLPISLEDRAMPMDLRTDCSLPAFTRCSLDDDPGKGAPEDGAPQGQSNLYLFWKTDDIVDTPERWEMTIGLVDKSSRPECTVDITPRRLQRLARAPGTELRWSNAPAAGGAPFQTGAVAVDAHGRITLPDVRVGRQGNRIAITPHSRS